MINKFSQKLLRAKRTFDNIRSKVTVRVWNLAKRLDPKRIRQDKKKGRGRFPKLGNQGNQ